MHQPLIASPFPSPLYQVDLQAMARVHRLGQTKPVHVYRLVSGGTAEERVVQRSQKKLFLSNVVNRDAAVSGEGEKLSAAEVRTYPIRTHLPHSHPPNPHSSHTTFLLPPRTTP
jgi:hypothetical protein